MAAGGEAEKSSNRDLLTFEEGWPILQEGVNKVIHSLDGSAHTQQFTPEEYMKDCLLYLSTSSKVVLSVKSCLTNIRRYLKIILPPREKKDEILLQELTKCWNTYKYLTRWLSRFFHYLDRYFVPLKKVPTMQGVSYLAFYELIDRERRGEKIDQSLVKNVVDIYLEMGEDSAKYYTKDFEEALIKNTTTYYLKRASDWITEESYKDYMLKVDGCLKQERDRVTWYLQSRSEDKIVEALRYELLTVHGGKLEEKKHLDEKTA